MEAAWSEPRAAGTRHVTLVSVTDTAAAPPPHHAAADVSARVPRGTGGLWCRDMVARINTALVSTVSGVTKQVRENMIDYNCIISNSPKLELTFFITSLFLIIQYGSSGFS